MGTMTLGKREYLPLPSSSADLPAEIENCLKEAAIPSATLEKSLTAGLPRPMDE